MKRADPFSNILLPHDDDHCTRQYDISGNISASLFTALCNLELLYSIMNNSKGQNTDLGYP